MYPILVTRTKSDAGYGNPVGENDVSRLSITSQFLPPASYLLIFLLPLC